MLCQTKTGLGKMSTSLQICLALLLFVLGAACSSPGTTGANSGALSCIGAMDCPSGQICAGGFCTAKRSVDVQSDTAGADDTEDTGEPVDDTGEPADDAIAADPDAVQPDPDTLGATPDSAESKDNGLPKDIDPTKQCKPTSKDEQCNGKDDNCDGKTDEGFADQDGDGIMDCVDDDVDGDNVPNGIDNCPKIPNPDQNDKDFNGVGDACDKDTDGDGVKDVSDNCPAVINQEQSDMDGDGVGDACDDDIDGDSIKNKQDNCPKVFNPEQKDTDKDGIGDYCDDKDLDLVPWYQDNCPTVANPKQTDIDQDGLGDACDPDMDNDTIPNEKDNCPTVPNKNQADANGDGKGDACSNDADGDGCPDKMDCEPTNALNGCDNNGKGPKELCDGKDNNCNGQVDEGFGVGGECGVGVCSGGTVICGSPAKSICTTDIGGTNTKQLLKELCNGQDDNCDGEIPANEVDNDGDTFRVCDGDCDDDNPTVCPSDKLCPEKCDGLDNNCNGKIDEGEVCKANGQIIGYIYDATDPATILKQAKVELRDLTCASPPLLTQTVNANGKFSFPSISGNNATYCLKVTYPGDEDQKALNVQLGNTALGIPGKDTIRQIDFGLKPFGYPFNYAGIAGKVWSATADELVGAQVVIKASGNQIATDIADLYGNYTVVALSPSSVDVTALMPGYEAQTKTVILKSNETVVLDFKLVKSVPKSKCFFDSFEWNINPGWVVASSCGQPGVGTCPGFHKLDNAVTVKNVWAAAPNPANATQPLVQIFGGVETLKAPDGTQQYWYGDANGSFIGGWYPQGGLTGGHGSASNGTLTSPDIELLGYNKFVFTVQYWYEIEAENPKSYDIMQLQISEAGKNNYITLKQLNPVADNYNAFKAYTSGGFAAAPVWVTAQIDLSVYKGKSINLRFRFNSGDGLFNGYRGWGVDNVKFICTM